MGKFTIKASDGQVDPGLLAWVQAAAANSPYDVILYSGRREGDPRFHGKGMATDINLIDPKTGKTIPNYQNAGSFQAYQGFANQVRAAQLAMNPERANALRWGGYFSGGKGKYGAMDLMHFDVGGETTPMGGGGWDTGLTQEQAALWNLSTGAGASPGGGTAPANPLADIFSDKSDPKNEFAAGLAGGLAKSLGQRGGTTNTMMGDVTNPDPVPSLEVPRALPSDLLETPVSPVSQGLPGSPGGQGLADLFQVKSIGQPPNRPGARF